MTRDFGKMKSGIGHVYIITDSIWACLLERTEMFLESCAHNSQRKQSAVVRPLVGLRATV